MKRILFSGLTGLALLGFAYSSSYAGDVNVVLKNSSGTGIAGATVHRIIVTGGNDGSPGSSKATIAGGGTATPYTLSEGTYKFQVTWNQGVFVTDVYNVPAVGTIDVDVFTTNVTYHANSNSGTENISGVVTQFRRFGNNTWHAIGTTPVDGKVNLELLPGTYDFRASMGAANNSEKIYDETEISRANYNQTGNTATIDGVITKVTLNAIGGASTPVQGLIASHRYPGNNSLHNFGTTDVNGTAVKYLFPRDYEFEYSIHGNNAPYLRTVTVSGSAMDLDVYLNQVTFQAFNGDNTSTTDGMVAEYRKTGNSSWRTFGTTDANGEVVKFLLPGDYDFQATYAFTTNTRSLTISGNTESAALQNVAFYLTQINITAKAGTENVAGLTTQYAHTGIGNSTLRAAGSTNANGENSYNVFPGEHRILHTLNFTTQDNTGYIVPGDGTTPTVHNINLALSRVKFTNQGTVSYQRSTSANYTALDANGTYIFPGERTFRFATKGATNTTTNYHRTVNVTPGIFNKSAAIIKLLDSDGNPSQIGSIRGGVASIGWHVGGTNGGHHVSHETNSIWIDISNYNANMNRIYEVNKNNTISTQSQNISTNNVFIYQTNLLTLRLQKCNEDGIQGGTMRVGYNADINANLSASSISFHWSAIAPSSNATDVNGNSSAQVFPGKFYVEMKTGASTQDKQFALTSNDTVKWTTTNVKLNYAGEIAYGKASITGFFSKPSMELLPGTLKISFRNNGENIVDFEVPENNCSNIEKTAAIIRLVNSSNQPIVGALAGHYQNGNWRTPVVPNTQANGNAISLLDGNVTSTHFRITHNYFTLPRNNVNLASVNNVIVFKTEKTVMHLTDSEGNPLEGTSLQHYAGGNWRTFGSGATTGGVETDELLPGSYHFRLTNNFYTSTQNGITITNNNQPDTVKFNTEKVTMKIIDSDGNSTLEGTSLQHYANGNWRTFGSGNTTNGEETDELFAGTYHFRMNNNFATKTINNVAIAGNDVVIFQTEKVIMKLIDSDNNSTLEGNSLQHYAGGNWRTFGSGNTTGGEESTELFAGNYNFRMTHNYVTKTMNGVNITEDNTPDVITFQTILTKVALRGYTINNMFEPLTEGTNIQYYAGGNWRNYGVNNNTSNSGEATLQLFDGTYNVRMDLNNTTQTINGHDFENVEKLTFTASRIYVYSDDHIGGSAQYYGNGNWRTISNINSSGYSNDKFILPGTYNFRITGVGPTATKDNVAINQTVQEVSFSTVSQLSGKLNLNFNEVSLYPNPATEYVTINVPSSNSTIEIFAIDGRKIQHIDATEKINTVLINKLISGLYKVVVTYENNQEVKTFVKK